MASMRRRILRSAFHCAAPKTSVMVHPAPARHTARRPGTAWRRNRGPRLSAMTFWLSADERSWRDERGWRSRRLPDCGYVRKGGACLRGSPARDCFMQTAARLFYEVSKDERVQPRKGEDGQRLYRGAGMKPVFDELEEKLVNEVHGIRQPPDPPQNRPLQSTIHPSLRLGHTVIEYRQQRDALERIPCCLAKNRISDHQRRHQQQQAATRQLARIAV